MYDGYLTDVEGIKVGHFQNEKAQTGCTVIICEKGATGGIEVRGSGPGTRETDVFDCKKTVDKIHAVVLSGGSAFGLNAAGGVMNYLEENKIGFDVGVTKVPIVPSAVIFDLEVGDFKVRPDEKMGYIAATQSNIKENRQGNIGAGTGASIGKYKGMNFAMKSGLGSATIKLGELVVSALVVVNAIGDVFDLDGNQIAGIYDYDKNKLLSSYEVLKSGQIENQMLKNTTIGIIATNVKVTKAQANKISEMAHNGYAKVINPIHTSLDGDTIFTMATGVVEADIDLVGTMASEVMAKAIINGIKSANTVNNLKSYKDI